MNARKIKSSMSILNHISQKLFQSSTTRGESNLVGFKENKILTTQNGIRERMHSYKSEEKS